jgi:type VI secretion system ImpM family protein
MPNPAAGFFGKLPSAGDFVQRRLPSAFVDVWDRHFENAVAESRQALGGDWHGAYQASPVWRFLLTAGVCGDSAWAGVMGPGTDRVGRCFPMVIAAPMAADSTSFVRALHDGSRWFDAVEQVHNAAQGDAAIGVDAFDEQVAALAGPLDVAASALLEFPHGVDWSAASHWRLPLPAQGATASFLGGLWQRLSGSPGNWCLWWTAGGERVPASVLITNGLPQPAAYAGFLDAGQVNSWQSLGVFEDKVPPPNRSEAFDGPAGEPSQAPFWLPDDPELFDEPGLPTAAPVDPPPGERRIEDVVATDMGGAIGVLPQTAGLAVVAAEVGPPDPRQRAVAHVMAAARDQVATGLPQGIQGLRVWITALNPRLREASEDLIDPVMEDCAVVAGYVAGARADLLRIGTSSAWHWRHGRLLPCFTPTAASTGVSNGDDFDDLLFSGSPTATPGLGATAQPGCDQVSCVVEHDDRLLLLATQRLLQLSPEILAHSLAMPSRDDARQHIASAAGLGVDPARWPLAIIEIDA